ncbi:MAG TPA: CDP-diacylglycerol--serine O-phosphatidyltransferase, partial [Verrucomicrobiae bacterium]|nr:CDP-diacylglycerol--serine O-phosphatidyltransferase [Verrucomicrobiae bacterium]
ASIYLLCGAFRLARFNCLSAQPGGSGSKDFLGFPIPSAAGLVASLTLLIIHEHRLDRQLAAGWNYLIAVVLLFLSAMMVSTVKYPSFKSLGIRSSSTFLKAIIAALVIGFLLVFRQRILFVLPLFFTVYLVYGFIRPHISRKVRHEIEEEDEDELEPPAAPLS